MFFRNEIIGDIFITTLTTSRATMKEAKEFKEMLLEVLYLKKRNVIIDLSECEFIESTFIGVIVYMTRKFSAVGGELKLINLRNTQNTIFEWTRLHRIFEIFNSREEAIGSFYNVYAKAV